MAFNQLDEAHDFMEGNLLLSKSTYLSVKSFKEMPLQKQPEQYITRCLSTMPSQIDTKISHHK